jgi:hypothetical protein
MVSGNTLKFIIGGAKMTESNGSRLNANDPFFAVCHDCGTVKDESFDNTACSCGGIFHVESARCSACGKRHHFNKVGMKCDCPKEGQIVPKIAQCPSCKGITHIDHLGGFCPACNVQLTMEG